ncbi:hypothetical protein MTYM_01123 [Methylococcales bacterium]|nr:hypothetical protein MTYM_01123 [Methylococcales bacterium]
MLPPEHLNQRPLLTQGFFLALISLSYYWISLPGLLGGFILDDWPNLAGLEHVKTHGQLSQFSLSGVSSQLGRPVSLLSFALQAEHWPHNPHPFKLAGFCIHTANAWLVYGCCYLIAQMKNWSPRKSLIFAGSVFTLWIFHPLNISTVFYVVQRMVLLAAFFSLIGVSGFLWAIKNYSSRPKRAFTLATISIIITYSLGILSKENAVLTGLGIGALYWLLLRDEYGSKTWDWWIIIFGILPSLSVISYLCFNLAQHTRTDFSPYQRLLTETVILQDYVGKILLPTPGKLNIFNDDFPVYKNLFDSLIGLQAVFFWLALCSLAVFLRKRAAFFAFGIFWFLTGHLLESSIFGLELYFEHRNYLPSIGILIGIIGSAIELTGKAERLSVRLKTRINFSFNALLITLATGYVLIYGAEISTWRSPGALAISALTERPNSLRAHQESAAYFANIGDFANSTLLVQAIEKKWPNYPGTYSQLIMLHCLDSNVVLPKNEAIKQRLQTGRFDRGTLDTWHQILNLKKNNNCPNLTWEQYRQFIEILINNKNFSWKREDFAVLLALGYNADRKFTEAAAALDLVPETRADLDFLILKAKFYAMTNAKQESLQIIERAKNRYAKNLRIWLPRKNQIEILEKQLSDSLRADK